MLATSVAGQQFVVLLGKEGEQLYQRFYADSDMSDEQQAVLRKVNTRVQNWKKENL
jgi:hypothetical protein